MSTLMSSDMNLTRSSTRTHAPPGGVSTISFGDASSTTAPAASTPKAAQAQGQTNHVQAGSQGGSTISFGDAYSTTPAPAYNTGGSKSNKVIAPAPIITTTAVEDIQINTVSRSISIVIAVTGEGSVGSEVVNTAVIKELYGVGEIKNKVNLIEVENPLILPYVVKKMMKQNNAEVIIAVAVKIGSDRDHTLDSVLIPELLRIGISSSIPIIPSVIQCENMLEVKALMSSYAASWRRSIDDLLGDLKVLNINDDNDLFKKMEFPKKIDLNVSDLKVEDLILDFRQSLKQHGASGIFGISRKFKIIDDDKSGKIDVSEFSKCIAEHAQNWNSKQIKQLFDFFDKDKSGNINFDEFLEGIRDPINDRRLQFVLQAFEILDADKNGVIQVNDVIAKYDGSKHPDVLTGKRTTNEILSEFLSTFDGNKDGTVTLQEFIDYYSNVSASIDLDDYFELMMRNAWHMSGGTGWCENSTCRRVLVIHQDGRQTVQEIKNDLGIKGDDEKAIRNNLVAQGVCDIVSIKLSSADSDMQKPTAAPPAAFAAKPMSGSVAAGQRPGATDFLERPLSPAKNSRQAPGGKSSLVLG